MLINVVQIGNSKGIRIPKAILDQCNIGDKIDLEIREGRIILEPVNENPRTGWDRAFSEMATHEDDALIVADNVDLEMEDWEW